MLTHVYKGIYFLQGVLLIVFLSCSKDSTQVNQVPPALPPESSFLIDFSDFSDTGGSSLLKPGDMSLLTHENWGWAATNVLVWNTVLFVNLAVPVAAFKASFQHEPVQQPDGSWLWSYSFPVGSTTFSAELYGALTSEGTQWDMYISKSNGFNKFLWYTGGADLAYSQGSWTIFNHPDEPVAFLSIEWHRNLQDSTADIKYTHLASGEQQAGSYIYYGLTNNFPYNAFYDIFHQANNNHVNIEWNHQTKEGRIKDPQHFQNSLWHCWNETLDDCECPN